MSVTILNDPLTLDLVKSHCRVYITEDDVLLQSYIDSSAAFVTTNTGRACVEYEITENIDSLTNPVCLEWKTEIRIATIEYTDTLGAIKTITVSVYAGNVLRETMPADYNGGAVKVTFTPYIDDLYKPNFIQIRLYIVADWFENRETNVTGISIKELPEGTAMLLNNIRIFRA